MLCKVFENCVFHLERKNFFLALSLIPFSFFFSFLLKKSVCLMLALLLAKAGHKKEDTYSSFSGTYVGLVGTNST